VQDLPHNCLAHAGRPQAIAATGSTATARSTRWRTATRARSTSIPSRRNRCFTSCPAASRSRWQRRAASSAVSNCQNLGNRPRRNRKKRKTRAARSCASGRRCRPRLSLDDIEPPEPVSRGRGRGRRRAPVPVDFLHLLRATAYYEYAYDSLPAGRGHGQHRRNGVIVTCGSIEGSARCATWRKYVDAAHVEPEGLRRSHLPQAQLRPAGANPAHAENYHELGVWFEVIKTLVVRADIHRQSRDDQNACAAGWSTISAPTGRCISSRFNPLYKLEHLPSTPVETLVQARESRPRRRAALRYIGNVRGVPGAETTSAPTASRAVIERDLFANHPRASRRGENAVFAGPRSPASGAA